MMTVRVIYNYLLAILGIREMLPREIIHSKAIRECNEPLVQLIPGNGLFLDNSWMKCRRSVAQKLTRIGEKLSEKGLGIYIYDTYRTPKEQEARINRTRRELEDKFSDRMEFEKAVKRYTAGVGGGHQSGGAVDLTICDKRGIPLDMGSKYLEKSPKTVTSHPISPDIDARRKLLCKAMREEGFVNYPGEWWHFSYGDQLWAAYRLKRYALYSSI